MALTNRNKIGFINGQIPRRIDDANKIDKWDRANDVVVSWLLASMIGSISNLLVRLHSSELDLYPIIWNTMFLMMLNDSFNNVRSKISMQEPPPHIQTASLSFLERIFCFVSKALDFKSKNIRGSGNSIVVCKHCNIKGHAIDNKQSANNSVSECTNTGISDRKCYMQFSHSQVTIILGLNKDERTIEDVFANMQGTIGWVKYGHGLWTHMIPITLLVAQMDYITLLMCLIYKCMLTTQMVEKFWFLKLEF
ncbi:hypothetical protein LXL04_012710 [Taraxacum kok-saghyz]